MIGTSYEQPPSYKRGGSLLVKTAVAFSEKVDVEELAEHTMSLITVQRSMNLCLLKAESLKGILSFGGPKRHTGKKKMK